MEDYDKEHINDLWEDMDRLNSLYEEMMWDHDDVLEFVPDYKNNRIIIKNKSIEKEYPPYIVNRCFSGHLDAVLFANEMNKYNFLPKKMQYDFFINILRTKKRFSPWIKKDKIKDLEYVKRYYGYSNEKALQVLKILTKQQLNFIKSKFEIGGTK